MEKFAVISKVSERDLPADKLRAMVEALNIQAQSHLNQYWGKSGSFEIMTNAPAGYIPFTIEYDIESPTQNGFHWVDSTGNPYARIKYRADFDALCLTASHEGMETIINPKVEKFGVGMDFTMINRRGEEYFEICDICQTKEFGYRINGVQVSNFVTPDYYNLTKSSSQKVKYDFVGFVNGPGEILEGGYKSWKLSDTEFIQAFKTKGVLTYKLLTGSKTIELTAQTNPFSWIAPLSGVLLFIGFLIFRRK